MKRYRGGKSRANKSKLRVAQKQISQSAVMSDQQPTGKSVLFDEATVVEPNDKKDYKLPLKKGQVVTIQAGADYPITVELISNTAILKSDKRGNKTIDTERMKHNVKNAKIEFEAPRNGTWFVHVHNYQRKLPLEVGVIISVE